MKSSSSPARPLVVALAGLAMGTLSITPAFAWMHTGRYGTASGGDGSWSAHGWRGGSASGGGGSWSGTGWRGGTASGGGGVWHATGANGGSAWGYHGSYYGGYHPPTTVNYYGSNCYNCGGWNAGAAAGTLAAGAVLGATVAGAAYAAGAASAQAPAIGTIYGTLPSGCGYVPEGSATYYNCGTMWLQPAFGANGVYYRVVAAP